MMQRLFKRLSKLSIPNSRMVHACSVSMVTILLLCSGPTYGAEPDPAESKQDNLAEMSHKLSNPVGDVWALFTEFDFFAMDGDINRGDKQLGSRMLFQPVLPFTLYGSGDKEWKLITRPTLPVLFSQPVPKGYDEFKHQGGLGDTQLPMLISPPTENWLLGFGPTWLFPTATREEFGQEQWGVGPAVVAGYHTKDWIAGVFPQYTWGIGGWNDDDKPDASYMSLLYFYFYNLPDAWQIGTNPTITYNHEADSGNKWNVPVGITVSKMTKIGKQPVKIQFGVEYSVVNEDDFGQRAQIKLNIIPVIPALFKKPIFGE
jgi:hypothetical protein